MKTMILRHATAVALLMCATAASATIHYVKVGGTGDGSSWENATGRIQAAIDAAQAGDQVWIAGGVYHPDSLINGTRPDCATSHAFFLKDGVSLYGGFAGTESSINERDFDAVFHTYAGYPKFAHPTILSADDDVPDVWVREIAGGTSYRYAWQYQNDSLEVVGTHGNSTHLLFGATAFTHSTVINGLTLQGANANIWRVKAAGGALYAMGNVKVEECQFIENSAYFAAQSMTDSNTYGGAVFLFCDNGEASITNCYFSRNYAHSAYGSGLGGAIYGRKVKITGCLFEDCVADDGGAVYNNGGTIDECVFLNCYASAGGAVFNNGSAVDIKVLDCRGLLGGGVYQYNGTMRNAQVANCYADAPEYGPTMGGRGGGVYLEQGNLINPIVHNNLAFQGGGIFVVNGKVVNGTVQRNLIRADYEADTANIGFHNPTLGDRDSLARTHVFNSIYMGEADGSNFTQPTTWCGVAANEADTLAVHNAAWRLTQGSEFVDAGTLTDGVEVKTDFDTFPRPIGQNDVGACEMQTWEHNYNPGDVNGDGKVDVADVNCAINVILKIQEPELYAGRADVDGDGKVDVADVNAIINIILKTT